MRKKNVLKLLAFVVVGSTMMYAQASRTWVSGVGDDANPCSRTAPCKTFAGAISKTAAGGEIDALDPGGFGALTITKAITIDGGGGQVASVLVAGTNGIVVQAGPNDIVILRNLRINGIVQGGNGGFNGIRFLSGRDLNVESCYIFGFSQNGIDVALNQGTQASVHVIDTVIKDVLGVGIRATNAVTPPVRVAIDHSTIVPLGTNTSTNIGVEAAQHSRVAISNSLIASAAADGARADDVATGETHLSIENSSIEHNTGNGVNAQAGATVAVGGTKLAFNTGCGLNNGGGNVFTFTQGGNGTNRGHLNAGGNTCGTISSAPQF